MNKKIVVIGSGAVGGFYGGLLAASGNEVTFLVRSDYDHCLKHGMHIQSPWGDIYLKSQDNRQSIDHNQALYVEFVQDPRSLPQDIDLIIICLKSTDNSSLPKLLSNYRSLQSDDVKINSTESTNLQEVGPSILLIQNGIGTEETIAELMPRSKIFAGLAFLCAVRKSQGLIHHIDYGDLTIAEFKPEKTDNSHDHLSRVTGLPSDVKPGRVLDFETLVALLEKAKIPIVREKDVMLARFKKLIWNVPFNGLSVVLNSRTDEMMNDDHTLELVNKLMAEVQLIAKAFHLEISDSFIADRIERTKKMKPYPTSMKLDYENKRPMEIEAIYGKLIEYAKNHKLNIPNIAKLYENLCSLESKSLINSNPGSL